MKTTNQIIRNLAAVLAIAALFVAASAARASVNLLSGGDSTDGTPTGYQPAPEQVYADYFTAGSLETIQGVDFSSWSTGSTSPDGNTTVTAHGVLGTSSTSITGASANDVAMNAVLQTEWYNNTLTFTFTGLATGRAYQIDALINPNDGYGYDFAFNGTAYPVDSFAAAVVPGVSFNSYDVVETVTAVAGQITMTVTSDPGLPGASPSGNIAVNAFSVTTVPEPASLGLLAVGGLMIFKRRRV